jgi:heptosyltransferase-2
LKPLPSGDQEPSALHGVLAKHVPPLPPRALRDLADKTATGFVVLHTGASTPYKTWPSDRWAALAEKLHADLQVTVVVVGDRRDKPTIPQQQAVISYAGDLSLAETAALIGRARLFAGSDSGLAHLAVALGTPSAVLFGPSDQNKWGIETPEHAVVANPLPCAPCSIFGYLKPCRTRVCMASLTVDQVYDACRKVIAHGSPYQPEAQPYPSTPL